MNKSLGGNPTDKDWLWPPRTKGTRGIDSFHTKMQDEDDSHKGHEIRMRDKDVIQMWAQVALCPPDSKADKKHSSPPKPNHNALKPT